MNNHSLELRITRNEADALYVIQTSESVTMYGYDVVLRDIDLMFTELAGRRALPEEYIDNAPIPVRGSMEAWDLRVILMDQLKAVCAEQGEQAIFNLSPQLLGLEGWRVQALTKYNETRRFIVGRSSGWAPCHIELARSNSNDGPAAEREYESVRTLEKVR
jgi:hypothetical protein